MSDAKQATPAAELERQICSATEPKNEREWWSHYEIARLRAELTAERERADRAEADKDSTKVAAWDKSAEVLAQNRDLRNQLGMALAERDELRERVARLVGALDQIERDTYDTSMQAIARTALEGK